MESDDQVIRIIAEFVELQTDVLDSWRSVNPASQDTALLLDFPKHCKVTRDGVEWSATRHGVGVRFVRKDGLEIDVPFAVASPEIFDPNRVFDYLQSRRNCEPSVQFTERESLYEIFAELVGAGKILTGTDSVGRRYYRLRQFGANHLIGAP